MLLAAPHNESRFSRGVIESCSNLVVNGKYSFDRRDLRRLAPQNPSFWIEKINAVGKNFRLKEQIVQRRPGGNLPARTVFFNSLQAINETRQFGNGLQTF